MLRLLAALLLIQLVTQASGLVRAAQGMACEDSLGQRESRPGPDDCSGGCEDCLCCPQHRVLVHPIWDHGTVLEGVAVEFPPVSRPRPDAPALEILHVPRARAVA